MQVDEVVTATERDREKVDFSPSHTDKIVSASKKFQCVCMCVCVWADSRPLPPDCVGMCQERSREPSDKVPEHLDQRSSDKGGG